MLYSIQIGVQKAGEESEAVMIYPVDMPLVNEETLQILSDVASKDSIILPKYKGQKRGHPILIGRNFWDDIMTAPLDIGARYVVYENKKKIKEIITEDKGVTLNINTPDIYHELIGKKGV
jgi:molybdenum cofactor cytidylyltransferase